MSFNEMHLRVISY